jgi:hypothetical protein
LLGQKIEQSFLSPDAINRPLTRIRHGDSRHRNRNAQYLVGPSSKDFQALRRGAPKCPVARRGEQVRNPSLNDALALTHGALSVIIAAGLQILFGG